MFQKTAKTATNAGNFPENVPQLRKFSNKCRSFSRKCSKKQPKSSRGLRRARYETRVGSPPDFQLKRVPAPNCLRALNRSAQAGRRANAGNFPENVPQKRENARTSALKELEIIGISSSVKAQLIHHSRSHLNSLPLRSASTEASQCLLSVSEPNP